MFKTSVLQAPSWAHAGEFVADGRIYNFAACVDSSTDVTSAEGMTYLQNVRRLRQVGAGEASDHTVRMYLGYKWPTEDDYFERNSLTHRYVSDTEGVIGLKLEPGYRIQEYVGTDYTLGGGSDVKIGAMAPAITWASVAAGAELYLTDTGQFTTATTNAIVRAQFVEYKSPWVTIEIVPPYRP